ncbi:MAG TPA: HAD-IA family hydrolase [Dongiaceae bacterium]|jgi:HAD superfamily hydrolase (TIGR01549 family)|nr:HAD-IA family hydrolase [Dongiaceae bacterium]
MANWLVFDVGETLASEERWLGSWADWLGVKRGTFFAGLGAIIEARRPYQDVFRLFRPDIDLDRERQARTAAGLSDCFVADDLYPDALPTLAWAREAGYRVGIAGNTSAETEDFVRALSFKADFVGSAARWNVAKPDPAFFRRIVAEAGCAPGDITYIGDSIDKDVLAAEGAGLRAIHIARGPWGVVEARWPEAQAVRRIHALSELPALIGGA